jgi:hypothetical protein
VAQIHRLFEGEAPTVDAAAAAEAALARSARAQLAVEAGEDAPRLPRRNRLRLLGLGADVLAGTAGGALGGMATVIGRVLAYRPLQWAAGLATFGTCAFAVYWLVILPRLPLSAPEVFAEYQGYWKMVEAAAGQPTSEAEWQVILADGESLAARSGPALKWHAESRSPVLQELLWGTPFLAPAVRDVRDGKRETSEVVSKFVIHLQNAERRIAREKEMAEEQLPASVGAVAGHGDRLLVGFVMFDGILVLAAGVFVMRRVLRR